MKQEIWNVNSTSVNFYVACMVYIEYEFRVDSPGDIDHSVFDILFRLCLSASGL
jgi:hypothetical protein